MYQYGLIGNCHASALVSHRASVDWLCFPRPDSPPVFGALLDPEGGSFAIEPADGVKGSIQSYHPNTNVLVTTITTTGGSVFRVTDFFPRYSLHGRISRPLILNRIVEPVDGTPSVQIRCEPVSGWSKAPVEREIGDGIVRFHSGDLGLKLRTNLPLTFLRENLPFALKEPLYFSLSCQADEQTDFPADVLQQRDRTLDYWKTWVKHCSIPTYYQSATIRSALALKLHCYDDTGAILAALTTSLPEEAGHTRNWDYRFCWLRDAYFCLSAFRNLGHFEEMEGFLNFLLNIAESHQFERLGPVYRLDHTLPLPELQHDAWAGYAASRPVRSGNQAGEHTQNDVYGEMVLTLAPIFFDDRFQGMRTPEHERLFEKMARLCVTTISQPDAGLWEVRNGWQEHSFSNLMSWAGIERALRVQKRGYLAQLDLDLEAGLQKARDALSRAVKDGVLQNGPTDPTLDAALLLLPVLNYDDKLLSRSTVDAVWKQLCFDRDANPPAYLYRYLRPDDFGIPQAPFLICSFWLVQALAKTGRKTEAVAVMDSVLRSSNELGLFAEHYSPKFGTQSGNFPQAYSHVGLINAAFSVSPDWDQVL